MQLTDLDRLLWALTLGGHCILLGVLAGRRRTASFPVFTALVAFNIVRAVVLYVTLRMGSANAYFYSYWTLGSFDVALQFGVVYELASHVFQPLGAWAPDVRRSFGAILAAALLVAFGLTWLASPATRTLRLAAVLRGNFFASVVMSELFVAMVALSVSLGLPWKTHVARLAQGFGIYSLFGIFSDAALSFFGTARGARPVQLVSHLEIGLYLACLAYWAVTLWIEEPAPRQLPAQLHEQLCILQSRAALILGNLRTSGSST